MSRRRMLLPPLLGALLVAGCGTTVPGASTSAASGSLGPAGAGTAAAAPGGAPAGAQGAVGSAGATGGSGAAGQQLAAANNSAAAGAPGGGLTISNGPGVTATTVILGVSYYQSAKEANAALGAKGVDTGDPVAAARILIAAINRQGGIAGRQVRLLTYGIDPQSSTPYATEAQAECTYFTEDHKVFAVIDGTPAADVRPCLAQRGVADFGGALVTAEMKSNEFDAYAARLDRVYRAMVPSLMQQGWFGGWDRTTGSPGVTRAKTGIVMADSPADNRVVDGTLIPALRRAGYAPAAGDVIRITPPGGFSDDGATVAAIDNAALKLNADGVDHVILTDGNGSLSLLFNNYAYSQHYFPRYGGTSGNAWQVLLAAGDLQAQTLHGAMGIGWQPLFDLPYQSGDGPDSNADRHACFRLFSRAGQSKTDAASAGGQAEACDVALLLPFAFRGYRGPINLSVITQHVEALGTSYPLASGFSSRFGPDHNDGTGAFKAMHFDDGCGCIQYSGGVQSMPD